MSSGPMPAFTMERFTKIVTKVNLKPLIVLVKRSILDGCLGQHEVLQMNAN